SVFLSGLSGRGRGHDDENDVIQGQTVSGVVAAVNPDLGTITIRTGPNDTLAIFPIETDTNLVRNGTTAADLSAFQVGDVALIQTGKTRQVSDRVGASPDATGAIAPTAGSTVRGAVVAVDTTAGTATVLSADGTLFLVETDAGTTFRRNGSTATLADFKAGDL